MAYSPHTPQDRAEMLAAIGVGGIEDLFTDVPAGVRFPALNLPDPLSELETMRELAELASANADAFASPCFLGAGAYNHYSPSIVNHMILRGEFLTAYTPYQPEVSQGTLQAVFEYQSMVAALTGMDVANASHYDGATSLAEAVTMAVAHGREKRRKVLISPAVHPHYRGVARTYTQGMRLTITGDENPAATLSDLAGQLDGDTAVLIVQSPNFFGQIEDLTGLAERVHAAGALLCVAADPISLGLLTPPGRQGADIVVGEGQSLGIPLSYGGPYLGFFATRKEYVRRMAGRLVGETKDRRGQRGYVLTLSTREQHIKREKASSNICTNQGLMALAATVYLSALGKHGLRRVAELCWHKSHYAAAEIGALPGFAVVGDGPFFKEFVVRCPAPVAEINQHLYDEHGLIGGYDLGQDYAHLEDHMLVCVTEMNSRDDIDTLAHALSEFGGQGHEH
ncbi:MAG: aminomethyl-transferring glycine dehydrogenase subunit GcvPA [Anaerolineales bacterium]|nr:aminomethyl-transferring glycine dehydrogenase subunit GcvPA [Anaerolineales bacterium]